ncbi:MAG: lytic transglycosylase domain-containing protein [Acetobacteraceae bacterium]|nr:lytic transglycosylase domain-containing protein [Acetobacteraceae bacterium]
MKRGGLPTLATSVLLSALASSSGTAATPGKPDARLCDDAISATEPGSGVPPRLLGAIARVESGRPDASDGSTRPWPWSINAEGRGYMFATKADAVAAVLELRAKGVAAIDVGCMQIDLMHHPDAFPNLEVAFDPGANVRFAARFLNALHAETGEWARAVQYYHSRTPELASAYGQKVGVSARRGGLYPAIPDDRANLQSAWAATRPQPEPAAAATASWVERLTRTAWRGRAGTLFASAR